MENVTNNLLINYNISRIQSKYVLYFMEFHQIIKYLSFENAISFKVKQITNSSLILQPIINSQSTIHLLRQRKALLELVNMNENTLLSKMINSTECLENSLLLPEEELIIIEDPTIESYTEQKYKDLKYENTRLYYNGYHTTNIYTMNGIKDAILEYHINRNIKLNLYSMNIGNYEMEFLCENFDTITNLQTLNLNGNDIEDEGVNFLASHFKDISNLETLYLNGNYISDIGIYYFCESCSILNKLKDLSLWKNKITDVGGEMLSKYLHNCPELNQLWINDNNISKRDIIKEKIRKNHPNQQIIIN